MKEYIFVRRYLKLNREEQVFTVIRNRIHKIQAEDHETAVTELVQQIDSMEGREGVLENDGFPPDCSTDRSRNVYMSFHCLAAGCYQEESEKAGGAISSFREQLANENDIYQGIYADDELLCPRGLLVRRLQCHGDEFNYLFYASDGYRGEFDKYLFYEQVLYEGVGVLDSGIETVSNLDV
jgi:hypothetical protein